MALEQRLRILEDITEITRLKARYCDAADGGWDRASHDPVRTAALFAEDGVWDAGVAGHAKGRDQIRALFETFTPLHFAFHLVTSPLIEVTGDEAAGKWHLIALLTHRDNGPVLAGGIYHDRFRRTAEGWLFSELRCEIAFMNPPEKGWDDLAHQAGFHPAALAA